MRVWIASILALVPLATISCDGIDNDLGLDTELQVYSAQFYREPMPSENGGPGVRAANIAPRVRAGSVGRCNGSLEAAATGVAIALEGDTGYWVMPAGLPDVTSPGFPTFSADIAFASKIKGGQRSFQVRAVDGNGRFGPALVKPFTVVDAKKLEGILVVSLSWDSSSDLDLHVVDPAGVEIWKRNISSYVPPAPGTAPPQPAGATREGGTLDFASHAMCVRDGLRRENVVWELPPPKGRYVVRVDTFSLCGQPNAYWRVETTYEGRSLGSAAGVATEVDTRFSHERGGGVLALEFDVP